MATALTAPPENKAIVLFDGGCLFCQKSIQLLKLLDWFDRLHFQNARETEQLPEAAVPLDPQRLLEEMHLLTPDRQHAYPGFQAFRWMAWRLPLTMLFAPLMYLPGVLWLGNKMYLWVARNRMNLIPCVEGVCSLADRKKK